MTLLLLLNSQASLRQGRPPNAASKLPAALWRQVFEFCGPMWCVSDNVAAFIESERVETLQRGPEGGAGAELLDNGPNNCIIA
jgi:hypothetical protein